MSNTEELTKSAKEVENSDVEQFEKIRLHNNEPFSLYGKKGDYTLLLGDAVVSERKFADEKDADEYLSKRPWEVILLSSYIYRERINAYLKHVEK